MLQWLLSSSEGSFMQKRDRTGADPMAIGGTIRKFTLLLGLLAALATTAPGAIIIEVSASGPTDNASDSWRPAPSNVTHASGIASANASTASASVFSGSLGCSGCLVLPSVGLGLAEADTTTGTLRAYGRGQSASRSGMGFAGITDTIIFLPLLGFGNDLVLDLFVDLNVHQGGTEGGAEAYFRVALGLFGQPVVVDNEPEFGVVWGSFFLSKIWSSDTGFECLAVLDEGTTSIPCASDGRYTLILSGLSPGSPTSIYFGLGAQASCGTDDCTATANAANTVHIGIRNAYASESGYLYLGEPAEETVPEPGTNALIGVGLALLVFRARCSRLL
jgi:hypothetical protein